MRIKVKESSRWSIRIGIPNWLLLSRFAAFLYSRGDNAITYKQAWKMLRAIKAYRRENGSWKLVEVQSADGNCVEVTI